MNEIVSKFLLREINSFLTCVEDSLDLLIVLMDHLLKIKKEYKNLKKQKILDILIKANWKRLAFSMTWLMEILKVYL